MKLPLLLLMHLSFRLERMLIREWWTYKKDSLKPTSVRGVPYSWAIHESAIDTKSNGTGCFILMLTIES